MKKNVLQFIVLFALIACLIPIPVNAKGKYISWKGSDTFHVEGCPSLETIPITDLVYYDSYVEAISGEALEAAESGVSIEVKKPCRVCKPDFVTADDYGEKRASGYARKQTEAPSAIVQPQEQESADPPSYLLICLVAICAGESLALYRTYRDRKRRSDELEAAAKSLDEKQAALVRQEDEERQRITDWKRTVLSRISEDEASSRARIKEERKKLDADEKVFLKLISETRQSHPMLAAEIADAQHYLDMGIYSSLINKQRPAIRAAEELKQIASDKRELLRQNRILQYQLDFYEKLFPWLEEFKEIPSDEAIAYATDSYGSEYDAVKKWLSPEEYNRLENAEKFQLALDRWKNRKKNDWDIGIEYERYIGYMLECEGYKVTYIGATMGLKDMGRDLLAVKNEKALVIQCKRWAKDKTIHEKHIFQLYGSIAVLSIENPDVNYKGVFITTATLSDTAKKCAEYCGISIVEACPIADYPLVKCNASKTGELIYHLPFDQQYDKVVVSKNKRSCYAWTTKEAESKGFRRAYRWHPNNT